MYSYYIHYTISVLYMIIIFIVGPKKWITRYPMYKVIEA